MMAERSEPTGTDDPDDRFGMPDRAFEAARKSHGPGKAAFRVGMYIPTRREVATRPPPELLPILDAWLWESPAELIPSYDQVEEVRRILVGRPDASGGAVQELVTLCDEYLQPPGGRDAARRIAPGDGAEQEADG